MIPTMKTILPPDNLKSARRLTPMELNRAVFTDRHTRLTPEVLVAMSKKTKT